MDKKRPIIGVIGSGSWATALIKNLTENNCVVKWWVRNEEDVAHILKYKHNPAYLRAVEIHLDKVEPSNDITKVVQASEWILLVVPAVFVKGALENLPKGIFKDKKIISAIKGMIPEENLLISDYVEKYDALTQVDKKNTELADDDNIMQQEAN